MAQCLQQPDAFNRSGGWTRISRSKAAGRRPVNAVVEPGQAELTVEKLLLMEPGFELLLLLIGRLFSDGDFPCCAGLFAKGEA